MQLNKNEKGITVTANEQNQFKYYKVLIKVTFNERIDPYLKQAGKMSKLTICHLVGDIYLTSISSSVFLMCLHCTCQI